MPADDNSPSPTPQPRPAIGALDATATAVEMSKPARAVYRTLRGAIWLIAKVLVRVTIVGSEHIPRTGGFILAPGGHRSILDTPLASLTGSRVLRYMGAETYFNIPGLGFFLRAMGGFPVERSMTDRAALRLSEEVLRNGEPLVVFPEGTRQEGPIVQPLKEGAAFLACRASVPIIPVGLGGAARAMPKGARYIRPSKVAIVIGAPIHPPARAEGERVKRSAVKGVSDELRTTLQELFDDAQIRAGA